jgi:hypothetical protein
MGMISLLYCQPPHRGKKLATFVEQKISQRNLKEYDFGEVKNFGMRDRMVFVLSDLLSQHQMLVVNCLFSFFVN